MIVSLVQIGKLRLREGIRSESHDDEVVGARVSLLGPALPAPCRGQEQMRGYSEGSHSPGWLGTSAEARLVFLLRLKVSGFQFGGEVLPRSLAIASISWGPVLFAEGTDYREGATVGSVGADGI